MKKDQIAQAYEELIERFIHWAEAEEHIRLAIIIGSRARSDHPADEWSDLDIIFFARAPEPYWNTTDWLHQIGKPQLTFSEPTPDGREFERRVLFEGGLDVDFVPSAMSGVQWILDNGIPPDLADMIRRGIRVLVDKEHLWNRVLALMPEPAPALPSKETEFLNVVEDFWYHTVWTAKHLRRGELWWGKSCCDNYLKHLLLRMLEWHARAVKGPHTDTWLRGRFLDEWADPRALAELQRAFAHYNAEDTWRALFATIQLFRWLSVETAERFHYSYPFQSTDYAEALVKQMFDERNVSSNG